MRLYRPWFFSEWIFPGACFRIRTREKSLFLTFDDGPDPKITPQVFNILDKHGVKAVFFCNGQEAERYPGIVASLKNAGHLVGNHGYEHSGGFCTGRDKYIRNVDKAASFTSESLFRPPYGRLTLSQFRILRKRYRIFFWDVMPYDFDSSLCPSECLKILQNKVRPGSIIVLHDTPGSTAPTFLDDFISNCLSRGYKLQLPPL